MNPDKPSPINPKLLDTCAVSIAEHDNLVLNTAGHQTLAEWWCKLNVGELPEAFTTGFPALDATTSLVVRGPFAANVPSARLTSLLFEILNRITLKECLREWNKERLPGTLFDDWWEQREAMNSVSSIPPNKLN